MSTHQNPELPQGSGSERLRPEMATEPHPESLEAVAHRLEQIRAAMGWENQYIAQQIGASPQGWGNYKKGRHLIPVPLANKLCTLTGVTTDFIFRGRRDAVSQAFLDKLAKIENTPKGASKRALGRPKTRLGAF